MREGIGQNGSIEPYSIVAVKGPEVKIWTCYCTMHSVNFSLLRSNHEKYKFGYSYYVVMWTFAYLIIGVIVAAKLTEC